MMLKHFSGLNEISTCTDKAFFRGVVEVETPKDLHKFGINDGHIKTILHECPWGFAIEEVGEYFEPLAWLNDPSAPDVGEWLPWHNVRVFMPA